MVEYGWCLQIKNGCHGYKCTLHHCYHNGVGGGEPQNRHAPKQQRLGYQGKEPYTTMYVLQAEF